MTASSCPSCGAPVTPAVVDGIVRDEHRCEVKRWRHERKGEIEGTVLLGGDETWMRVRLTRDHRMRWFSSGRRGEVSYAGETMTLRRSLMTEVETNETNEPRGER